MASEMHIQAEEFGQRLAQVKEAMSRRGLEGLIVFGLGPQRLGNLAYLANYRPSPALCMGGQEAACHALVLAREGLGQLVSPLAQAREALANVEGVKSGADFNGELAAAVRSKGLARARLGVAGSDLMPVQVWLALNKALPTSQLEPADDILRDLRCIKSPQEIECLGRAARVGEQALLAALDSALPGSNERQVELRARGAAYEVGAESIARVTVNSGRSLRHRTVPATDRVLRDGDFILVEMAGWAFDYAFSCAKVKVVGEGTSQQAEQLQSLEDAAAWLVETLKPQEHKSYVKTMHGEQQILPLAHGIGLDLYEYPWIAMEPTNKRPTIHPNSVMCIEPLVIDPKFGSMAIRKMVLVGEASSRVLGE